MHAATVLLAMALCLSAGLTVAATIEGRVVGVTDGDTVTVLDAGKVQHEIRLAGIDAPEKAQPFGQRSKENLSTWVFGKKVLVETDKLDRYGRTLGKVMVNGVDANLFRRSRQALRGTSKPANESSLHRTDRFMPGLKRSRAARARVWRDAVQIPPWHWLSRRRKQPGTEAMDCGAFRR